jgi:hypothetical protein
MKKMALLLVLIALLLAWSCGSKSEDKTAAKEETEVVQKRLINNQDEFNQALEELGITVFPGAEFVRLEAKAPANAVDQTKMTTFTGIYNLSGTDYSKNFNDCIGYYKIFYYDNWKTALWRDTSIRGSGILNYHPGFGDFNTVSFVVKDYDQVKENQPQEMHITLFVR